MSKNVVLGYDVMKMMLSVMKGKKIDREEFRRRLAEVRNYISLHSVITFTPRRVNGALTILQYANGRITEITHELWNGEDEAESQ